MKIYRHLSEVPARISPTALSIGNFDGVHRGHVKLIGRLAAFDAEGAGVPAVLSFDPHPQQVLRGISPPCLTPTPRKLELLSDSGIRRAFVLPFDEQFSQLEPEDFAGQILKRRLNASVVVVGSNFRFGRFARGDVTMLRDIGKQQGFKVVEAPLVKFGGRTVSSTEIRHAIEAGDLKWANKALGRPHRISGSVVEGAKRGATMGFPTANLTGMDGVCVPAEGVYAGWALAGRKHYKAAISVGTNPTFGGGGLSIEAFLMDFRGNLYGKPLELDFVARLRGQQTFSSVDALSVAMARDVEQAQKLLGRSRD